METIHKYAGSNTCACGRTFKNGNGLSIHIGRAANPVAVRNAHAQQIAIQQGAAEDVLADVAERAEENQPVPASPMVAQAIAALTYADERDAQYRIAYARYQDAYEAWRSANATGEIPSRVDDEYRAALRAYRFAAATASQAADAAQIAAAFAFRAAMEVAL